jgi:hypothetical protein
MHGIRRWLLGVALVLSPVCFGGPTLTTIQDSLYKADGTPFNGVAIISCTSFVAADSSNIAQQILRVPIVNGNLYVQLVPTTTATPSGTYTVQYNADGRVAFSEQWAVPPSASPLGIQDVRVSSGTVVSPPAVTGASVQISAVVGLQNELDLRPTMGTGFVPSRTAVIDANGAIDGAVGNATDCMHVDGTSGPCGGQTNLGFIDGEVPSGALNGVNATFSLANTPNPATSLELFRNGLLLQQNLDYSLSGSAITFQSGTVPQPSDTLQAFYRVNVSIAGVTFSDAEVPAGTINGANATFTLANSPNPAASFAVYRNGILQEANIDFTLSGASVTFASASTPQTGDTLLCFYRH